MRMGGAALTLQQQCPAVRSLIQDREDITMEQVETKERRERLTKEQSDRGKAMERNKRAEPREMPGFRALEKGPPRKMWESQERRRWAAGSRESLEAAAEVSLYEEKSELV